MLGRGMFKDSIFSKNKEDALKFELYKIKETYDLDKAMLALSNERIITVEGYYKNGESILEKVELDKENILEKKKTLEENYKNRSKKIIQIEANVGSLKEASKTYASTVEML